ncbi:DUF3501 family protein [Ferrimonas marina]|uniref:DUF3501 domain-containing protein n=1 Tax=Ferrimonas marina TaxID=299255 RepID=A0A1M5P205_9GAMM|nr:DUF3501 family protein [Ferrimonas marina]SHG95812.1 Protein of unknown function [Ferrimonas marina]
MTKLERDDLLSLEEYALQRARFRAEVMRHKQSLQLNLGPHLRLLFEDRLTVQYQIQEMLRIERLFEPAQIQEELDAYNPLIPDGGNWKATMMLEYPDEQERRQALGRLVGIEDQIALKIGDLPEVLAIADEDLERSEPDKTASVHFLRWELTPAMRLALLHEQAPVTFRCHHPNLTSQAQAPQGTRQALLQCLVPLREH